MLKVRVIPRGPYRHSNPAAMLCEPCRFKLEDIFFSPNEARRQILREALKKQSAEEAAMAGIKVMSSVRFPTFTSGAQESINPIVSEDSDDQEENDALGRGKRDNDEIG